MTYPFLVIERVTNLWARLGYSIEEAGKLAENTMVLMNVSEFDNVSEATDSMISAIQAFKGENTDIGAFSMDIIDVFNQIGNSYAISTSDLADSLTRSSASLVAANNTLEQSVALTTAANTTIQNPEVVGTTLKTLAMRIRGVKTELEEAGEDTEGMITNTSKLQAKVQALTNVDGSGGVNILANSGEFKSTYDILLEISKVWDKMNDMDQAALLEIIAGKRAGSAVAGILQNGDILKSAYEDALGADGSAQQELSTYLDSIQGKLDQLSNSTQTMWMNFMESDTVKFFIDLATSIVKATDKIGLLNVAVAAFMAKTTFKGDSFGQFFNVDKTASKITGFLGKFKSASAGAAAGVAGVGAASKAATVGVKLLNSALSMGISLLAGIAIGWIIDFFDDLHTSSEEAAEAIEEASDAINDISSEFKNNQKTVQGLSERFAELAQGVDMFTGKNLTLNTSDYEEFLDLSNQLANIFPTLSRNYDENGNAIVQLSGDTDTIVGSLNNLLDVERQIANQKIVSNIPDLYEGIIAQSRNYNDEIKKMQKERATYEENLTGLSGNAIDDSLVDVLLGGGGYDIIGESTDAVQDLYDKYAAIFKKMGFEFDTHDVFEYDPDTGENVLIKRTIWIKDYAEKTQEELNAAKEGIAGSIDELATEYVDEINGLNSDIDTTINKNKANWSTLISSIFSWLQTDDSYAILSDDMKASVQSVINNLDFSDLNFSSWEDLKNYIQTDILSIFTDDDLANTVSNSISGMFDAQEALQKGDLNLGDYQKQVLSFVNSIKKSDLKEEIQDQILQMFDIDMDKDDSIGKEIDKMIARVQKLLPDSLDGRVLELSYSDLQIVDSDNFNVDGSTIITWEQLQNEIKETKVLMTEDFTTDSFSDYADGIDKVATNISTYQEALEKLESGKFTITDFVELIEQFPDLAKGVDVSSKKFKGLASNLKRAIRSSPEDLVEDLETLREQLVEAGKSTTDIDALIASIKNMPEDAVDGVIDKYSTLTEEINAAKIATNELKEAMQENPNEGYETRGEAIEKMKTLMEEGKIGSESELWSIAEEFGFTYDSAKTINENADALHEFITTREKWYKTDKDGNYQLEGIESFIKYVAGKQDVLDKFGATWTYKDGVFDFDLDNEQWEEFAAALGLTSEEFSDLMIQIGQFYGIEWGDADDVTAWITKISEGAGTAEDKLKKITDETEKYAEKALGQDLDFDNLTLEGIEKIKMPEGMDTEEFESVIKLLKTYIELKEKLDPKDPLKIKSTLDESGLAGLSQIKELQDAIKQDGDGLTVLDEDAFTTILQEAGYAAEDIDALIKKIKEYQQLENQQKTDPLGIKETGATIESVSAALNELDILYSRLRETPDGEVLGLEVNAKDLITTLKEKGWTKEQIDEYLQTLQSDDNSVEIEFDITQPEIDAALEEAFSTGDGTSSEVSTDYKLTGTGKEDVETIETAWEGITEDKETKYTVTTEQSSTDDNPNKTNVLTDPITTKTKESKHTLTLPGMEQFNEPIQQEVVVDAAPIVNFDNFWPTLEESIEQEQEEPVELPVEVKPDFEMFTGYDGFVPPKKEEPEIETPSLSWQNIDTSFVQWGEAGEPLEVETPVVVKPLLKDGLTWFEYTEPIEQEGPVTVETPVIIEPVAESESNALPEDWWPTPEKPVEIEMPITSSTESSSEYSDAIFWLNMLTDSMQNYNRVIEQGGDGSGYLASIEYIVSSLSEDDGAGFINASQLVVDGLSLLSQGALNAEDAAAITSIITNIVNTLSTFTQNGGSTTEVGSNLAAGIATGLTTAGLETTAATVGTDITTALQTALANGQYPVEVMPSLNEAGVNYIEQFSFSDKEFDVDSNASTALKDLKDINNYTISDKSYTVTETRKIVGGGGGHYTEVNGTAHAQGTAFKGGSWGATRNETALVGELGPEILVRDGKWTTIGENGAEFAGIRQGDIIFNHKQTEELLKNGYVTGRGKAYAEGTAFASGGGKFKKYNFSDTSNSASKKSKASKSASKSSKELSKDFKEIFDWIEVHLEEITEAIDLSTAKLDNAIGYVKQNKVIDEIIGLNQDLHDNLIAGAAEYYAFSEELLKKVPEKYREMAQDGAIAIESFTGKVGDKTLDAIKDYREWVQKGADATQQAEETLTEISALAKQAIDNIAADFENKTSLRDGKIEQYEAYNSLLETDVGSESASIYQAMINETNKNIQTLEEQRNKMQAELNKRVESGQIKKYSQDWYDVVNNISEVDTQIIELRTDTEDWQDAINELHWDHFDILLKKLEAVSEEADNLIDILSNKDLVDPDTAKWTDEGITSLGLYAQQMEAAEVQARKYEEEIKYLNKNWQKLGYTEEEYIDKLDELKSGQYDAIQAYHDTKDAIVDLTSERVEAIKEGIQKEIEAYEELISKKKEELDAEKD